VWGSPGGDYDSTATASFVPDATGPRAVNITSLAQFWVNNPGSNYGVLLRSTTIGDNGDVQFKSLEDGSDPPRLLIEYLPGLTISDISMIEGDNGTTNMVFTVTLAYTSSNTITVDYATADNTATIANNDYLASSGTLTFSPGITTRPITVTIVGDTNVEGDEAFLVNLSSPTNAAIADGQGIGLIQQDLTGFALPVAKSFYLPLILKR
jgi:hypothetical protein